MLPALLLIACICLLLHVQRKRTRRNNHLPAGPRGWPLIGNAFQLDPLKPHETLTKWAKQYGDVYTISMYGRQVVVANSDASIQEVLVKSSNEYAGRAASYRAQYLLDFRDDIAFTSSLQPQWSTLKKSTMNCLRKYADDVSNIDDVAMTVIQDLLDRVGSCNGKAFDPVEAIHDAITTMITSMVYGTPLGDADIQALNFVEKHNNNIVKADGNGAELDVFPWLRFLPNKNFNLLKNGKRIRDAWFKGRVEKVKEGYDDGHVRGLIDALFTYQTDAHRSYLGDENIEMITRNLVFAGMTTTSRAVYALILLLAKNPSIQQTAQHHINDAIGNRAPHICDRSQIPYIESMTFELLRYISHLPMCVPHVAVVNTKLLQYNIPNGTEIWPNLWHMNHNEDYWEKPWSFIPDRFLDPDTGQLLCPSHPLRRRLLAFGAGRRVCVGERFARHRMFLVITSLLQRFTFIEDPADPLPDPDPRGYELGFVLHPPNFKIKAIPRDANTDTGHMTKCTADILQKL